MTAGGRRPGPLSPEEVLDLPGGGIAGNLAGRKIFGIGDDRIEGIVVAGGYAHDETDGEFWEPSELLRFGD
ncbi:hypothetical protein ACFQ6N_11945 [Kitasatospora sp. NPDC056446]|uniref:hypothetical protein n=1 Tax=Kitasatospora sp. NPDC056446 TaxID=3345819 RepID=UPI003690CF1D